MTAPGGHKRGSFLHSQHGGDLRAPRSGPLTLRPEPFLLCLTSPQPESSTALVHRLSSLVLNTSRINISIVNVGNHTLVHVRDSGTMQA